MIKLRTLLCWLCLCLLCACGGGGGDAPPTASPPPASGPTATVAVTLIDTQGRFVAGAAVASASGSASSDAGGVASLPVATGSEQLLRIEKSGFAEQVKLLTVPDGRSTDSLQVMLIERDAPVAIAAIEAGGSAGGRDGVKVTFPGGALVDGAGNAVIGTIQMQMTPVDVTAIDAGAFPGAFEGTPTGGKRAAIMSYGTAELLPLQNGQKLQLAAGKTAEIELPIYAGVHQGGTTVAPGDTIALWSLDASTGVWTQEGSGTVVASPASPTGMALRATISHFSWWNGDVASQMGTASLTVVVPNPNTPIAAGTLVQVNGRVVAGSGPAWVATGTQPVGVATALGVPADATTRLSVRVDLPTQVCTGSADVNPAPGATVSVTISAVCTTVATPIIVEPADPKVTNGTSPVLVTVTFDGPLPDSAELLVDGVATPLPSSPQEFYRTFFDAQNASDGTHTLVARGTTQGVVRASNSVTVIVDRTPPQQVAIAPTPGSDVDPGTEYTVDFDEPVNPGPFALSDVVKLTVTPAGQSTPQPLAATLAYDNQQQRLTARLAPNQTLPLGVVGLSWGGLRDGAGNAVTGTVAATWRVSQVGLLGTGFVGASVAAAMDGTGTVFTVGTRQSDGALVAMRGPGFVPVGPILNDRALQSGFSPEPADIAIDPSGAPVVAFLQVASDPNLREVAVKRYDAGTDQWVQVGPVTFTDAYFGSQVRLAIDNAGRPIVAYLSTTSSLGVHILRFDGTNWIDLGTLSDQIGNFKMTLDSAGLPVVALLRQFIHLFVQRYDGSTWLSLGTVDQVVPGDALPPPGLALDTADQPWLTWNRSGQNEVRLAHFDGNAFVPVTVTPALRPTTHALTFVQGEPVVAGFGSVDAVVVVRLHNGVWEDPLDVPGGNSSIVLLPSGNTVTVVDRQSDGLGAILLARFP